MPHVYILYSESLNLYYTGFTTLLPSERLENHLNHNYNNKFTSKVTDWLIFLEIACQDNHQAQAIERHIKKMKSKVYIQNLIKYPEIVERLKLKYV